MKLLSFSKRPTHTLLFVTEQKTLRLDVDKAGIAISNMETLSISCSNATKLAACISTCASSKPLGRNVWLLYANLTTTFLTVPSMQVENVDEATLVQALQFEWEGLTGQSSVDMQLAYSLLSKQDDMSNYWITQINQLLFEDVQKAIKTAGGRLAGLLHPAGLPLYLSDSAQSDWLRLECWTNQIVALRNTAEQGLTLQSFSIEQRLWRKQLDQWMTEQGSLPQSETLQNLLVDHIELLPDTAVNLHLHEDEVLINWLTLWASVLVRKDAPVMPILRAQSKINKDLLMMLGGGLGALLICGGHLGWHLYQARYYTEQTAELKKIESILTTLNTAMASDRDKVDKLSDKLSKLKGEAASLPLLIQGVQQRPARLLAALAQGRPDNLLVEEISVDQDRVIIRGVCLDAVSANELASYLEKQLAVLGWSVIAPTKKNLELFADGGPWEFALTLLDKGLAGFAKK